MCRVPAPCSRNGCGSFSGLPCVDGQHPSLLTQGTRVARLAGQGKRTSLLRRQSSSSMTGYESASTVADRRSVDSDWADNTDDNSPSATPLRERYVARWAEHHWMRYCSLRCCRGGLRREWAAPADRPAVRCRPLLHPTHARAPSRPPPAFSCLQQVAARHECSSAHPAAGERRA